MFMQQQKWDQEDEGYFQDDAARAGV